MPVVLWGILALAAGLATLALATRLAGPKTSPLPTDVTLSPTPLQRLSRAGLAAGALLAAGAAALLAAYGPERLYQEDGPRLAFTLVLLAIAGVFLAVTVRLTTWARRTDGAFDERDRAILERAPAYQARAMLVTLAVWMVALVERFHGAGAVPIFYLYLVFWSCWVVDLLALPVGVLAGYRRR
jgi:hypothetical protein